MAQTTRTTAERREPPELARARQMGRLLDESLRIPGTQFRVGLDPILGIVPYVGDGVASLGSLYIVLVGFRLGVPSNTLAKMIAFVAIDYVLGSVPVLGTIVDAVLKVNTRNVATIESHVAGGD